MHIGLKFSVIYQEHEIIAVVVSNGTCGNNGDEIINVYCLSSSLVYFVF